MVLCAHQETLHSHLNEIPSKIESMERSYQYMNNGIFPFLLNILGFYLSAPCRAECATTINKGASHSFY